MILETLSVFSQPLRRAYRKVSVVLTSLHPSGLTTMHHRNYADRWLLKKCSHRLLQLSMGTRGLNCCKNVRYTDLVYSHLIPQYSFAQKYFGKTRRRNRVPKNSPSFSIIPWRTSFLCIHAFVIHQRGAAAQYA